MPGRNDIFETVDGLGARSNALHDTVRILVIDNYDSFTYNLVQLLGSLGANISVFRNDEIDIAGIAALRPDGLVISPGPGRPEQSGVTLSALQAFAPTLPTFGVCLGLQALAVACGARLGAAHSLMHGKTSQIWHDGRGVFAGLPPEFTATRYHSLAVVRDSLPAELEVTAQTADGEVMGLRHRVWPAEAVQFHPESFLTEYGDRLLLNFLLQVERFAGRRHPDAPQERAASQSARVLTAGKTS
ncbi:MAG: aminodeoxychorismate/anthranilate synthase component II [Limnochordaceae bacterium]|nr:aminodeoxychorismate/anthranilate synthase component II [Limnochordaceae bacterium]